MDRSYTHLVVIVREGVPEVTGFPGLQDATVYFDQAGTQWSESFLTEIVYGPGKPFRGNLPPVGAPEARPAPRDPDRVRVLDAEFYKMVAAVNAGPPPPSILAVPARTDTIGPSEPTWCPECGQIETCDEDGCCAMCGADIVSEKVLSAIIAKAKSECDSETVETRSLIGSLRRQITIQQAAAERRNRDLDALHYVWCSGGCETGVHRFCGHPDEITEDVVATVERQALRLREWYKNRQAKKGGQNG